MQDGGRSQRTEPRQIQDSRTSASEQKARAKLDYVSFVTVRLGCTLSQRTTIEPCLSYPFLSFATLLFSFFFSFPSFSSSSIPIENSSFLRSSATIQTASAHRVSCTRFLKISLNRVSFTGLRSRTVWRGSPGMNSLYRYPLQRTRRLGANEWSRRKPLVRLAPRTGITETIPDIFFHRAARHASFPRSATSLKATHFSQRNSANEIVPGSMDSEELRVPVTL